MKKTNKTTSLLILAASLLVLPTTMNAGRLHQWSFDLGIQREISGNSYGTQNHFSGKISRLRHSLSAGVFLNKNMNKYSGWNTQYQFVLGESDPAERNTIFFMWVNADFDRATELSRAGKGFEEAYNPGIMESLNELRFRSFDVHAGFGLKAFFCKRFSFDAFIGVGGYKTLSSTFRLPPLSYREGCDFSLMLGSSLSYTLFKK